MKKITICIFVFFFSLQACKRENDALYFNGEIVYVATDSVPVTSVKGNPIELNDIYTDFMSAYDTLLSFDAYKYNDKWLYVFNLNTYNLGCKLLPKGQGPGDFLDFSHTEQYILQDNSIKLWGRDALTGKIILLNLTQSIREQKAVIDSTLFLEWKDKYSMPFGFIFMCNNGYLLVRSPLIRESEEHYTLVDYNLYKPSGEKIRSYKIYNTFINRNPAIHYEDIIDDSRDRLKPDQTKLAMVMVRLAQINIVDIETGKIKGFRLKKTPGFTDVVKDPDLFNKFYYVKISVDDSYIYGLYNHGKNYPYSTNEVHVFDWGGKFVRKILLDINTGNIAFDPVKKQLYSLNLEDQLFVYDLSFLY